MVRDQNGNVKRRGIKGWMDEENKKGHWTGSRKEIKDENRAGVRTEIEKGHLNQYKDRLQKAGMRSRTMK